MAKTTDPYDVEFYRGLCRKTASIYVNYVEEEYEDIVQILHLKCWRALCSYDPAKSTTSVERYVFSCMKNQCKDLVKKKKRNELHIEDVATVATRNNDVAGGARDKFDMRYLSEGHDEIFGEIDEDIPLIPSTLSANERAVVCLMFSGYRQNEIALRLRLNRNEVERAVKAIRIKMADWRPAAGELPTAVAA